MMMKSRMHGRLTFMIIVGSLWIGSFLYGDTESISTAKKRYSRGRCRQKNKKPKEKKERHTLRSMNFAELLEAKERALSNSQKDIAIKYIEQMMKVCDDVGAFASLMRELADLYFETGFFEKALRLYGEIIVLYPGAEQLEYVEYRAILCSFYCTLDEEHDQTKTEETINRVKTFLEKSDIYQEYANEVVKIQHQCYEKLIAHFLYICKFNLHNRPETESNLKGIERRLATVRNDYLPYAPEKEGSLLVVEIELAQKKHNEEIVIEKIASLESLKEHGTLLAKQTSKKGFMRDRF